MTMLKTRLPVLCFAVLLGVFFGSAAAHGAPAAKLWPYWQKHDRDSRTAVDHSAWDSILKHYVTTDHPSGINRFSYSSVTEEDRRVLQGYLRKMQAINVSGLNRPEQMAFWINLYNAQTVEIILRHYPVKSIKAIDISPGFFSNGPWDAELLTIEDRKLSLNDIEHRILRPIWQDNRIHYAVNCASLGCPNLLPRAYTAESLDLLLDKAARDYVNHPRGVSFTGRGIAVSSIYIWFKEDFGGTDKGILRHLRKHLSAENLQKLAHQPQIITHRYDWALNE